MRVIAEQEQTGKRRNKTKKARKKKRKKWKRTNNVGSNNPEMIQTLYSDRAKTESMKKKTKKHFTF